MKSGFGSRLEKAIKERGYNNNSLSKIVHIHPTTLKNWITGNTAPDNLKLDIVIDVLGISREWLLDDVGEMSHKKGDTVDHIDVPNSVAEENVTYNSFNNKFEKLPNGEYLMYMPLFEWDVAASLLDHQGDTRHPDYEDVAQHVVVVKKPMQGKYSAFRIKGGSMEGTVVNRYIPDGSIVWGRELQRVHWANQLGIKRFPLWIIGSTDFGRPTLKEITSHDTATATITVDSWNPSAEYAHNVQISLNTVKMLYYVFKVETPVADIY